MRIGSGDDSISEAHDGSFSIHCGADGILQTTPSFDDSFPSGFGFPMLLGATCFGLVVVDLGENDILDSTANNIADDIYRQPFQVVTDPLRRDTDSDLVVDD